MPCFRRFKDELERVAAKIDYFEYLPQPKMTTGPATSIRGACGTCVLLAVVLAYMTATLIRWFTVPPSVSLTQTATLEEEIALPRTCITLPQLDDPTYWRYSLVRISKNATTGQTENATTLNVTVEGKGEKAKLCISDPAAYLRSFCNPGDCVGIKFKLFTCDCPIAPPPGWWTGGTSGPCVGYNATKDILERHYCTLSFDSSNGVVLLNTPPKIIWSSKYFVYFQLHQRLRQPDYLERFHAKSYYHAEYASNTYSLQYFWGSDVAPQHEVLEVEFRLGSTVYHTNDNPQTSLDLLGSWGAFFGVISGVLMLYFQRHNMNVFYRRFPSWERIDANFEVAPLPPPSQSPSQCVTPATDSLNPPLINPTKCAETVDYGSRG